MRSVVRDAGRADQNRVAPLGFRPLVRTQPLDSCCAYEASNTSNIDDCAALADHLRDITSLEVACVYQLSHLLTFFHRKRTP